MFFVRISYFKQLVCVVTVLSCPVYLQFYAEISGTIAVEDRFGFVLIVVDTTVSVNFVVVAFRSVVIAVEMISVILM